MASGDARIKCEAQGARVDAQPLFYYVYNAFFLPTIPFLLSKCADFLPIFICWKIEIYVINRIIYSTGLSPYSLEYESRKTTKYEHIIKKLLANPSLAHA